MEQEPLPNPDTSFDNDAINPEPMKSGRLGGIGESIGGRIGSILPGGKNKDAPQANIRTKAGNVIQRSEQETPEATRATYEPKYRVPTEHELLVRNGIVPNDYEVQNGLLFQKKSLAERVRDQLKFPIFTKANGIINGAALIFFASGAYILYAALPTRPELVVGILMVTVAGNVIVSSR